MPEKRTTERAKKDKREGKAPSTQAGEYVREAVRKPYIIYNVVLGNQILPEEIPALRQKGYLEGGTWTKALVTRDFPQVMNGNLNFAQSAVEQLTGDNNLIAVRSRATQTRPFTRIQEMEARMPRVQPLYAAAPKPSERFAPPPLKANQG